MNSITLYFTQGQHDKFWRVWTDASGSTHVQWGRRGTTGTTKIMAESADVLILQKMRKGYSADPSGIPHSGPDYQAVIGITALKIAA